MLKKLYTLLAIIALGTSFPAFSDMNNPMTRAVMEVYERQLQSNPSDYQTWMARANEYYRHSEYMRALNDVENALKYIPAKETAERVDALLLRANIYTQTGRNDQALTDLNSAIALDPQNYVAVYQRGNTYYAMGQYAQAKTDFQRLMGLNSRSTEGIVGLARVAVKENNLGQANEYLEQAVALDPNNADIYVRRATVRRDMGNHQGAVDDLILALAVDSHNNRAINMLVEYGDVNYAAVMKGLTDATLQAPNVGMYPYIRAMIAQYHYHYKAALADYQSIIDKNLYNYQGIWRSMAECQYAMGQFNAALNNVNRALDMDPKAADAALLKAKIFRALGQYDSARIQAELAVGMMPGNVEAVNELGLANASMKDYQAAADRFAESTILTGPTVEGQYCYLLRAWMLGTYLNQPVAASGFYNQVYEIASEFPEVRLAAIYGAFGQLFNGKTPQATAMIDMVLDANKNNPRLQYLGACFYAQADNFDKAIECAELSLEAGYANYYDWAYESAARINVAPLRDDLRFLNLLQRYKHLWE